MKLRNPFYQDQTLQTSFQYFLLRTVLLVALIITGNVHADAYLDALQQESDDLQYLDGGKQKASDIPEMKQMTIDSFEKFLAEKNAALFSVYRKLNTTQRLQVHRSYNITLDLKKTELMIHELHLSKK